MPAKRRSDPEAEARDWFARLGRTKITTAEVYEFHDWRSKPANDAAYTRLERETPQSWGRFLVQPSPNGFAVIDAATGAPAMFANAAMTDLIIEDANDIARILGSRSCRND